MSKECAGRAGLVACAAGAAVGLAIALSGAAPGQVEISIAAGAFLALSNFVPAESESAAAVAAGCCFVGAFLGFGGGAAWREVTRSGDGDAWGSLPIPLFLLLVMAFHAAEFAFVACFHKSDINFRALMLSPVPSGGYSIALIAALVEYWAEAPLFGAWADGLRWLRDARIVAGFCVGSMGWALRTAALFTAQANFTHLVAHRKEQGHMLVTGGVYSLCRHPGYVGWFLWSVSTQVVLGNPICFAAYVYVSWRFFAGRIPGEEDLLIDFFGEEYLAYARRVPCGIPGISSLTP